MTAIPNSFQTPNVIVDRAMPLLTNSELRVLLFAIRHIFGWKDSIDDRENAISLSRFEQSGLSRGASAKALESLCGFGFIARVKDSDGNDLVTEHGQVWKLTLAIDWQALEVRNDAKKAKRKQQTAAGRAAQQTSSGESNSPAKVVSPTDQQWSIQQTSSGELDRPTKHTTKHTIKHNTPQSPPQPAPPAVDASPAPGEGEDNQSVVTSESPKPSPLQQMQAANAKAHATPLPDDPPRMDALPGQEQSSRDVAQARVPAKQAKADVQDTDQLFALFRKYGCDNTLNPEHTNNKSLGIATNIMQDKRVTPKLFIQAVQQTKKRIEERRGKGAVFHLWDVTDDLERILKQGKVTPLPPAPTTPEATAAMLKEILGDDTLPEAS